MTVRYYSSAAGKMVLQLGITAVATNMQVDTTAGLPGATPFTLIVDVGLPSEEVVTVSQVSGNTLVVIRGEDGTSAQPHASGAVVRHAITARDFRDSRDHENADTGVHGVSGDVVGTSDTQSLSNKDLTSGTNTFPATLATSAALAAEISTRGTAVAALTAADAAHAAATSTHGVSGSIVGTTDTQTLTGKTIDGASNTLVVPQAQVTDLTTDLGAITTAATALDGRVTTLENGLPDKIKTGSGTLTFNGSGDCVLTHGLGTVPTFVAAFAWVTGASAPILIMPKFGTATTTQVTLSAYAPEASAPYTGSITNVGWIVATT